MKLFFIAGAAALALASTAQATQFVTNGDFTQLTNGLGQMPDNTTATGWSSSGYNFAFAVADQAVPQDGNTLALWDAANGGNSTWNGLAAAGGNFAAMDGDYITGPISQTINGLTVGQTYTLTFNYAFGQQYGFDGATVQHLTASLGSSSVTTADFNVANHGFSGWQSASDVFTATAASETLSFLAYGNLPVPPFALVSNVSLIGGVPEPAAWAMMLVGVGALGALARRRRALSAVAA